MHGGTHQALRDGPWLVGLEYGEHLLYRVWASISTSR
jgi:hypothetical protein